MCELCGAPTILDESSVDELVRMSSSNVRFAFIFEVNSFVDTRYFCIWLYTNSSISKLYSTNGRSKSAENSLSTKSRSK